MGRFFGDALDEAQSAKEAAAEAEKKQSGTREARTSQPNEGGTALARGRAGASRVGPQEPVHGSIHLSGYMKTETAAIDVWTDGRIEFVSGSLGEVTLQGNVNSTKQDAVAKWLIEMIKETFGK